MNKFCKKIKQKKLTVAHVCEVGVYHPGSSNILPFIYDGIRTTLVEPNAKSIDLIKEELAEYKNITLYPVAVFDYNGQLEMVQHGASSYVSSLENSPALINEKYIPVQSDKTTIPCQTMDTIDDGTIDLLSVDTEGSEWYVFKNLKSRPKVISVETHGRAYKNPFYNEIMKWMKDNDYILWYRGKEDSVFIKNGLFKISPSGKVRQVFMDLYLRYRVLKYK